MKDEGVLLIEILQEGMRAHAAEIPVEEQCMQCGGRALLIRGGHSIPLSVNVYKACPSCDGTGHKKNDSQRTREQVRRRKLPTSEESSALFRQFAKKYN